MITPSWADYGTHDEAYYPELWHGCIGAWCPSLGMSGAVLYDHSRAMQHGALVNVPATRWVSGPAGMMALDFIGGTSPTPYVDIGTLPYDIAALPFTLSAWFYQRSAGNGQFTIVSIGTGNYQSLSFMVLIDRLSMLGDTTGTANWDVGIKNLAQPFSTFDIPYNAWIHGAVTKDVNNKMVIYVNGLMNTERELPANLVLNDLTARIGAHYSLTDYYVPDGYINDVRLYRRALPAEEIALLASAHAVAYIPRRRTVRRIYSIPATFNPAWARHSNIYIPAGARLA